MARAAGVRLRPAVQHLEYRWLFAVSNGIVEYPTDTPGSGPIGAVMGGDRNLWVTEYSSGELVAFRPNGSIAETVRLASGNPYGIAADAAGDLWITVQGASPAVDEYSTGGQLLASYALPAAAMPQGITVAPNGDRPGCGSMASTRWARWCRAGRRASAHSRWARGRGRRTWWSARMATCG